MQHLFRNIKEQATFHEATPLSTKLIWPVFVICLVVMGLGVAAFLIGNKNIVGVFGKVVYVKWLIYIRKVCKSMLDVWHGKTKLKNCGL